jgi:hypothetical protein
MEWTYDGRAVLETDLVGHVALVYLITCTKNGKYYIGKKRLIKKTSKKPLKGKKRKRITYAESDWRSYFGSSDALKEDLEKFGPECFTREVLVFCKTLGASSYIEAKYQFITDCILDTRSYNVWISCRSRAEHLKGIDHEVIALAGNRLTGTIAALSDVHG